jgi:class 3 adenylate cyclase
VQVGIHTSVELVGAMGRGDPRASLVVGETPTMAARLQRLAGPDTVVISPATGRLVDGYVCCAILGTHRLEDRSEPVTVYRVLLALTLYLAAALHRDRAEAEAARQRAEAAIALATAQGFPHWVQSQHC